MSDCQPGLFGGLLVGGDDDAASVLEGHPPIAPFRGLADAWFFGYRKAREFLPLSDKLPPLSHRLVHGTGNDLRHRHLKCTAVVLAGNPPADMLLIGDGNRLRPPAGSVP